MLQALIGPVTGLLDKFIPDADEKARIAHELATMSEKHAQSLALAQIEVNKAEAASGSVLKEVGDQQSGGSVRLLLPTTLFYNPSCSS